MPGSLGRTRVSCLGSRCWRSPARWTRKGHGKPGAYSWRGRQAARCHAVAETVVWGGGSRSWSAENLAVQPSVLPCERQLQPLKCHHLLLAGSNFSSVALSVSLPGSFPFLLSAVVGFMHALGKAALCGGISQGLQVHQAFYLAFCLLGHPWASYFSEPKGPICKIG